MCVCVCFSQKCSGYAHPFTVVCQVWSHFIRKISGGYQAALFICSMNHHHYPMKVVLFSPYYSWDAQRWTAGPQLQSSSFFSSQPPAHPGSVEDTLISLRPQTLGLQSHRQCMLSLCWGSLVTAETVQLLSPSWACKSTHSHQIKKKENTQNRQDPDTWRWFIFKEESTLAMSLHNRGEMCVCVLVFTSPAND